MNLILTCAYRLETELIEHIILLKAPLPYEFFRTKDQSMTHKKIVITGASGFVGRQLVPLLAQKGAVLLLVGRQVSKLNERFPQHMCCEYSGIVEHARGFDQLVHLAALNNDEHAEYDQFRAINVDLLVSTVQLAKEAKISRFINVSSIHTLDAKDQNSYAKSKREGLDAIKGDLDIAITTVFLPLVYSDVWAGKLGILNHLPRQMARLVFKPLAAIKPTLHAFKLANELYDGDLVEPELILTDGQRHNIVYQAISRTMDLAFAVSIVVIFWWMLVLIGLLIRLRSDGPAIFLQNRVGQNGRVFTCIKYRTMAVGTAQVASHEASPQSISPLGSFLRRYKLDELPQVWNIFLNQIKLIGPRPCLPTQLELIQLRRDRHVLDLKPGISGLSQVAGIDMSNPHVLAILDSRYLNLQCLTLDLKIIVATLLGRGNGDRTGGGRPAELTSNSNTDGIGF